MEAVSSAPAFFTAVYWRGWAFDRGVSHVGRHVTLELDRDETRDSHSGASSDAVSTPPARKQVAFTEVLEDRSHVSCSPLVHKIRSFALQRFPCFDLRPEPGLQSCQAQHQSITVSLPASPA